jgi:8-oxo-dGTP diphosphatase
MDYVLGFQFDQTGYKVVLIRKARPEWQAGLWNGIGGRVEQSESPEQAMLREFQEETGVPQDHSFWQPLAIIDTWMRDRVFVFSSFTDQVEHVLSVTDESVDLFAVSALLLMGVDTIYNVPWLVSMALSVRGMRARGSVSERPSYMVITELAPHRW